MQLNFSSSVQAAAVALLSYYITAKRLTHSNFTHVFSMLKCRMKYCYVKKFSHFIKLQTMHSNIMRLVLKLGKNGTLRLRKKIKKCSSFFEMACNYAHKESRFQTTLMFITYLTIIYFHSMQK